MVLDGHGIITGWRGAAEALFGYQKAEAIGCPIDILFLEEDRALELLGLEREIAVAAQRSEDDRWHLRRDGLRIWVTGSLIALREGDTPGFAKVLADRTNLRAQLDTTENRLVHAHVALQGRDVFFGRLTHEVRNALGPPTSAEILDHTAVGPWRHRHRPGRRSSDISSHGCALRLA